MTRQDKPTYQLFALPPGDSSASGVSVGEADTLEAAADVLEGVLKPGETGVAVRPGQDRPEAVWVRTARGLRRGKVSAPVQEPKAETYGHIDLSDAYEAQYHVTVLAEELPRLRERIDALRAQANDAHADLAKVYRTDAADLAAVADACDAGHYLAAARHVDALDTAVRNELGQRLYDAIRALAADQEPVGIDEQVLFDALKDNLSPRAVAAVVAYLQPANTNNPEVNRQLRWLSDRLTELVGGSEQLDRLTDELGL